MQACADFVDSACKPAMSSSILNLNLCPCSCIKFESSALEVYLLGQVQASSGSGISWIEGISQTRRIESQCCGLNERIRLKVHATHDRVYEIVQGRIRVQQYRNVYTRLL